MCGNAHSSAQIALFLGGSGPLGDGMIVAPS